MKKWLLVTLILIVGVLASRTLFKHNSYFNMHDDLQMMRQLELEKCFQDGQIPCRWVADMGYGFGLPLYNYYPQLPYLFGEVFRVLGFPFNDVAKLTFALGIIASGFAMFVLAQEFFGPFGGLLSSVFYMWAPYHALDVYVRGAMNESWGWVWFPLILWAAYKLIVTKAKKEPLTKYLIILSLSFAALLLTHNIMVMIFTPPFLVWSAFWFFKEKAFAKTPKLILSGVLSLGLAAFFTLPAIFEQKLVHIESLVSDYFQYTGHFTSFGQLFFSRFWGDGPSTFGINDGLAFPVGHVHWILILVITFLLVLRIYRTKKIRSLDWVAIFGIIVGTGAAFMTHERSTPIWLAIPPLKFVQFPWRFLTLNVLGYSLAIGALFNLLEAIKFFAKKKIQIITLVLLSIVVIAFNWTYFAPVHSGPLTDSQKLSGEAWRLQTQAGIRDYLPLAAVDDPNSSRKDLAEIFDGEGNISNQSEGTNWIKFDADLKNESNIVRINIFAYPEWKIFIDGKEGKVYVDDNEQWGRMYTRIPTGEHSIYLKLYNTPLRTISNTITVLTVASLLIFWERKKFLQK